MNELVSQIVQRTGIGEDKARLAAQIVISFLKTKSPSMGSNFDGVLKAVSKQTGGMTGRLKDRRGGIFGKKAA